MNEFWVTIQRTEASERCGLAGNYWLKAESDVLILKEPKTKRHVLVWPYKLLRRYGRDRVSEIYSDRQKNDQSNREMAKISSGHQNMLISDKLGKDVCCPKFKPTAHN